MILRRLFPENTPLEDFAIAIEILNDGLTKKLVNNDLVWGGDRFSVNEVIGIANISSLFLAEIGSTAVGTVSTTFEDERVWGSVGVDNGSSLYIHKLVTANRFSKQGYGAQILETVGYQEVAGGRDYMRLNFPAGNDTLRSFYSNAGFEEVGETTVFSELGGFECVTALFQRKI